MKKTILFSVVLFLLAAWVPAEAADEIIWPYFSLPTFFIVEEEQLKGPGAEIQDLLIRGLPQYKHKKILASPYRMFEQVRQGKPYFLIGAVKTQKRQTFMHFSLPVRVSFYDMVVLRTEDAAILGEQGDISLEALLKNPKLTFGHTPGVSYGHKTDSFIEAWGDQTRIELLPGPSSLEQLIKMLMNKRIDWMLGEPTIMGYYETRFGLAGKIKIVPIRELEDRAGAGYVGGPKNEWGRLVVDRINQVLRREILSGRLFEIQSPWIPRHLLPEFKKEYQRLIYLPTVK